MKHRWVSWVAGIGAATCTAAAALSFADSVGATPASFFLRNRFWFSSMRVGGVPVEFFGMLWFLAVFGARRARATSASSAVIAVCVSGAAITGFAIWFLLTRSASCWPFYVVAAASAAILAASALDTEAWPDSFSNAVFNDLRVALSSPRTRGILVVFTTIAALSGSVLHVIASGVTREQAFERDLRRWYLRQRPAAEASALLPARAGDLAVVEFTDYFSTAARNVAPQRASQLGEFERHGLSVTLVSKHLPSEQDCNPYHTGTRHAGACDAAYAVKLASLLRGPRDAQALAAWLYSRAPALSPALIRRRVEELGMLDAFISRQEELRQAVRADAALAQVLRIGKAPAYFINGVRMPEGRGMLVRLLRFERERRGLAPDPHPLPTVAGGITGSIARPSTIRIDGAPSLGDPAARLVLVEFADFQCSFCAAFARTSLPALKKAYIDSGRLRFVFMHLPLPPIHAAALPAAEISECARKQDRFWPLHDLLFERQNRIEAANLRSFALEAGADPARLERCLAEEAGATVAEDTAAAYDLDIRGTPAFFLGYVEDGVVRVVQRLQGAKPLADFTSAIDALLARGAE